MSILDFTKIEEAANVCEHGDHEAPDGKRFCSDECLQCEHDVELCSGCKEDPYAR